MIFKKILVPIDGSKKSFKALDRALNLANLAGSEITCLHVIPHVPEGGPRTKGFDKQIVFEGKNLLNKASKIAMKNKIKIKEKIIRGSPSIVTTKFAKTGNFDHIVMSSTGSGSASDGMLESVSNYVLHKAKIPVYLVK